jgi:hypothetical protein
MEGLRRVYGIAEPVRRGMELKTVREGEWRAGVLGGSAGVSGDVLEGRDWRCEWEDVFVGKWFAVFLGKGGQGESYGLCFWDISWGTMMREKILGQ